MRLELVYFTPALQLIEGIVPRLSMEFLEFLKLRGVSPWDVRFSMDFLPRLKLDWALSIGQGGKGVPTELLEFLNLQGVSP